MVLSVSSAAQESQVILAPKGILLPPLDSQCTPAKNGLTFVFL